MKGWGYGGREFGEGRRRREREGWKGEKERGVERVKAGSGIVLLFEGR